MSSFTRPPKPFGFSPDFSEGTDAYGQYGARRDEQARTGRGHHDADSRGQRGHAPDPYVQAPYVEDPYAQPPSAQGPRDRGAAARVRYDAARYDPSQYDPSYYDPAFEEDVVHHAPAVPHEPVVHDTRQDNGGAAFSPEEPVGPSWLDLEHIPSWLRPFTLDANTRFTRTPDHFLRPRDVAAAVVTCEISNRGWHFVLDPSDASDPPAEAEPAGIIDLPDPAAALAALPPAGAFPPAAASGPADTAPPALESLAAPEEPEATAPPMEMAAGAADLTEEVAGAIAGGARLAGTTGMMEPAPAEAPADVAAPVAEPPTDAPVEAATPELPAQPETLEIETLVDVVVAEPALPEASMEGAAAGAVVRADVPGTLRALDRLLLLGAAATPPVIAADQDIRAPAPLEMAVAEDGMEEVAFAAEQDLLAAADFETFAAAVDAMAGEGIAPDFALPVEDAELDAAEAEDEATEATEDAVTEADAMGEEEDPAAGELSGEAEPDAPSAQEAATSTVDVAAPSADAPSPAASSEAWPFVWRPYQQSITARFLGGAVAPGFEAAAVAAPAAAPAVAASPAPSAVTPAAPAPAAAVEDASFYELPPLDLLREPPVLEPDYELSEEFLDQSSAMLQQVLRDFGVRGEVIDANPGPVVTLYEFEPAPGVKSSRVIGLSPDIARSMSAVSARVAVVEGRNVIGIELPNRRRDTVWLRELLASHEFADAHPKLGLCLGKTIGGVPVIADLARMPHLLVAGTTGSGKSVAINTMILSLLYRHTPEACRLIMIDPKMLELSVYEGIPHLLTPVVTDPKKAIIALKWAVKEMEERYRKMSRLAVRNIDGFNARVREAAEKGEVITRNVQVGFDKESGEALFEEQEMDLTALPYIVVIVDEMADLMMVAGKEIEGAIQRLAQMARAAGIHLVMATQRPSVDVITGTIKANFPTRISFQVTSKIDSRTILGEMGAETLLGQGDMLFMAGGGRITRVHGPFVSDGEVEKVVAFLKAQGGPDYLDAVILDEDAEPEEDDEAVFDRSGLGEAGGDLYEQAVAIVMRDRKASTSYIQRRLQVGYNKAASLMERMENEGIVGPANHAGKREILTFSRPG